MHSQFIVALFVIGNLVGSGFFMLPTLLAPIGGNLITSWAIAGTMAIMFAMMFGRLYMLFPNSSVMSDYFETPLVKRAIGIVYWISCIIGNAGVLIVIVGSLNVTNPLLVGSLLMLFLTLANGMLAYENVARIEVILTILKFTILLALPVSLVIFKPDLFAMPSASGSKLQIASTAISCFWAFLGIETAGVFGSGKSAKRGLLIGVLACICLYVLTSLLIVGSVSKSELMASSMPFALFMNKIFGSGFDRYISFIIAFTAFGALYGWVAATSKMSLLFAETKVFPEKFLKKARSKTSNLGLWISSIATFLIFLSVSDMDISSQFSFVIDITVYLTFVLFALCSSVLIKRAEVKSDYFIGAFCILAVLVTLAFDYVMTMIALAILATTSAYLFTQGRLRKVN